MSIRSLIFTQLDTDSAFKALVPQFLSATTTYGLEGRVPIPDLQVGMFGLLVWSTTNDQFGGVTTRVVTLRVYDVPGSLTAIEQALRLARLSLRDAVPLTDDSGTVFDVHWDGDQDDFYDPDYKAVMRASSFTIQGTGDW